MDEPAQIWTAMLWCGWAHLFLPAESSRGIPLSFQNTVFTMYGIPLTGLFYGKWCTSAIYDHNEALRLKREQLAGMGLRPFEAPAFQVGRRVFVKAGGYLCRCLKSSCMLDSRQI